MPSGSEEPLASKGTAWPIAAVNGPVVCATGGLFVLGAATGTVALSLAVWPTLSVTVSWTV